MSAGSLIQNSAYLPAFYAYAVPAIAPVVGALLLKDGMLYQSMGLLLGAFSVALMLMARNNNGWISDNVQLKIEQGLLTHDLQATTADLKATVADLQRHHSNTTAVGRLSDILQACQTRDEAYPLIAKAAQTLFGGASGALSLAVPGSDQMETVARWGADQSVPLQFPLKDCWALRTGHRYELASPSDGAACQHFTTPPTGAYNCLPLTVRGETTGLLHMSAPTAHGIDDDLRRLMLSFGDVVKLSLYNLALREDLSEQVMRDPLTGLFNRRYLAETLPREVSRAKRDDSSLSVAMMDLDHFKALNDRYGHGAGDVVLKELGAMLQSSLRGGDIACRYGGEEFLLVLPECNLQEAQARLQEIAEAVRNRSFTEGKQLLPPITVSIGVAELAPDLPSAEALIAAADEGLYKAKHDGRDRIEPFIRKPRNKVVANAS